ncbi:hypothetical protein CAOG_06927 [Capsaspora owczarzaki ATCC 30864]|uniref:hypothetical protein n=1 Tax=Capsaspora owczarzaki (strain ATCC 30864) TaxID=595528 RepID=UPI000352599D|nr:hypothetical protein CAOG_06927 [Capsaspora owczarzaki ATCC 30864]|eukprot:XP_004344548.2 hypothetical protein CAOG_06927 [Capsaspora owczarzaki ATCC 30864]
MRTQSLLVVILMAAATTLLAHSLPSALAMDAVDPSSSSVAAAPLTAPSRRTPVIIDTDIGTDMDDTWAIAVALASPVIDVRLVLVATHNTPVRAQIAAQFLTRINRTDIPIGIGTQYDNMTVELQGWAANYSLDSYPGKIYYDGVQAMNDIILAAEVENPVVMLLLAPCNNMAEAERRFPAALQRVSRAFAMSGSIYRGYNDSLVPTNEYNVRDDPASSQLVYSFASINHSASLPIWSLFTAPLDTSGLYQLDGIFYQQLLSAANGSRLISTVLEMYKIWLPLCPWANTEGPKPCDPAVRSSVLYDVIATVMLISATPERYMEYDQVTLQVTDTGFTTPTPNGPDRITAALKWLDMDALSAALAQCIISGCQLM